MNKESKPEKKWCITCGDYLDSSEFGMGEECNLCLDEARERHLKELREYFDKPKEK